LSKALKNIKYISDFRQTGSVILYAEAYAIADVESTDSAAETNIMDFTNGALIKIQSRDSDRKYTIVDTYDKIRSLEGAHKSTAKILVSETRWKLFYIGIPDALNVSGFIAFVSKIFADEGIPICLYSMVDAEYVLVGEADLSKSLMVLNENDIELISAIGPTH
jgi:hypothetical protein